MKYYFILLLSIVFYKVSAQHTAVFDYLPQDTIQIDSGIVSKVDVPPEFPGGLNKLFEQIHAIKRNQRGIDQDQHGICWLKLVVEQNGFVTHGFDIGEIYLDGIEEFYRNMPYWTPAKLNGKNVRCKINIPIHY